MSVETCPCCGEHALEATGGPLGLAEAQEPYQLCPACGWDSSPCDDDEETPS